MVSRIFCFTMATVVLLMATQAAAEPDSADTALAEALFVDGRALMKEKKYDVACPKFEESYRLVAKLGTLLNLAACHDEQGKTGSAWGEYTKAITEAKTANETERVEFARKKLDALEGRLSKVVVEVASPVPGIDVTIAATTIRKAAWGTPIPLDPGEHELVVRAPGHTTFNKTVDVPVGPSTTTVTVPALQPIPQGEEPEEPVGSDESSQATIGWVVGAIGLVGIGIGAGFGVNTFVKKGDSSDHCDDNNLCDQTGVDLRDAALTSATVSTIAFAVGGAAVVAGIIIIVTAPSSPDKETALWIGSRATAGGALLNAGLVW